MISHRPNQITPPVRIDGVAKSARRLSREKKAHVPGEIHSTRIEECRCRIDSQFVRHRGLYCVRHIQSGLKWNQEIGTAPRVGAPYHVMSYLTDTSIDRIQGKSRSLVRERVAIGHGNTPRRRYLWLDLGAYVIPFAPIAPRCRDGIL